MSAVSAGAGDTIFALASGAGRAAISVVRLSGSGVKDILAKMLRGKELAARHVSRRMLLDPEGNVLDHAVVISMPGPASYTGEDVAELHLHGGPAVLAAVSRALADFGARPAEPGEFTRRAFLAGKMDLLEAEGIADLIEAETETQRRQALRQIDGDLCQRVHGWSDRIHRALAFQEALIDFPDESLPDGIEARLVTDIEALAVEMSAALAEGRAGERVRSGLVFAIIGAPNVGKSSLMNRLARRDVAIISPAPGTTRDILEVPLVLGGVKVTLIDTAGLRETEDPVEAEGIRRARDRANSADLVIGVTIPGNEAPPGSDLILYNKIDLAVGPPGALAISAITGEGLDGLECRLVSEAIRLTSAGSHPVLTRARHFVAVQAARDLLVASHQQHVPELRAEELRLALQSLGRLTGAVDAEAVLGEIFAAFCIGK
jgi:tRNA modification GTPase